MTVNAINRVLGSMIKEAITNAPKDDLMIRICAGKPSRYMAIRNDVYTSARPNSCCKIDKTAGAIVMAPPINWYFSLLKSISCLDKNFAKASAVNILQSSAGCKLNPPPRGIQLLEPLIFLPMTKVATISNKPNTYMRLAKAVKSLLSVKMINVAISTQNPAKYNCLL